MEKECFVRFILRTNFLLLYKLPQHVFLVVLLLFSGIDAAYGHAVVGETLDAGQAGAVRFSYSTGDYAAYTGIKVFAPGDTEADTEYQNGRTDAAGCFAFVPDRSGNWTLVLADTMGHKLVYPIEISMMKGASSTKQSPPVAGGMTLRIGLGLSLIANIALTMMVFRRRRSM